MNDYWVHQFKERMKRFSMSKPSSGHPVSIKIRVTSGCFHREHSPRAYDIISQHLRDCPSEDVKFIEHESGPELLVWLALGTAGVTLVKSVIDLIATIIKARSEGIRKGDHPSEPLELIVREVGEDGEVREEQLLTIAFHEEVDSKLVEKVLLTALEKFGKSKRISKRPKRPPKKGSRSQ